MRLELDWSDYKSDEGSRSVFFPGGLQLTVTRRMPGGNGVRHSKHWRVTWWARAWSRHHRRWDLCQVRSNELPGLTDRRFPTRSAAIRAAERIFVPILRVVPSIVGIEVDVTKSTGLQERKARRP